jgi:NAD-dependent SIR2 family protein deacetylase
MKARCIKCGEWFPISKELESMIEDGTIHPVEVNLCPDCSERMIEALEYEYNELEN